MSPPDVTASGGEPAPERPGTYRFGRFVVDVDDRSVTRNGMRVPMTRKAFETLRVLLEHAGRTVTKQALFETVWPQTVVSEATLTQNVYTLRKLLQTRPGGEGWIETVPGTGYRFTGQLERVGTPRPSRDMRAVESVAVLPFRALDPGTRHDQLGVCLADALITRLGALGDVAVRPSSAIFPYADRTFDPVSVGRDLQVDAILVGTLLGAGTRLRANVQLVDVRTNTPLWAERFDVPFTDVLSAEDEITEQVVATIFGASVRPRRITAPRPHPRNETAYRAYVRGRYFWNKRSPEALDRAMQCFREALGIDPDYAEAHAGLADCHAVFPIYADTPTSESLPQAQAAASRALQLAPDIAEPHASLAYTRFLYDWDWIAAEEGFRRAIDLDPHYATAHHWFATLLSALGRHDEAILHMDRALSDDPLSLVIHSDLALALYFAGRGDDAIRECERALDLDPTFAYAYFVAGLAFAATGRVHEAVEAGHSAVDASGGSDAMLALSGYTLALAGETAAAERIADQLEAEAGRSHVPAGRLALVYAGLGRARETLHWLDRACEERSRFAVFLNVWPIFDAFREEPEFARLLARLELPA
ncbi:winged helix-turn-helix domain-containing protein [bacterium]|nr:winged helix-turn-helix domain-containing protein [bacterium]